MISLILHFNHWPWGCRRYQHLAPNDAKFPSCLGGHVHSRRPARLRRVVCCCCPGRFSAHVNIRLVVKIVLWIFCLERCVKLSQVYRRSNITMGHYQKTSLLNRLIHYIETSIVLGLCGRKPSSLRHYLSRSTRGWNPKSCGEQSLQWLPLGDLTDFGLPAIWWSAEIIEGRIFPLDHPDLQCLHSAAIEAHHPAEFGLQICQCRGNQGCGHWGHQQPQFKVQRGWMFLGRRWKDWSAIWSSWLNESSHVSPAQSHSPFACHAHKFQQELWWSSWTTCQTHQTGTHRHVQRGGCELATEADTCL